MWFRVALLLVILTCSGSLVKAMASGTNEIFIWDEEFFFPPEVALPFHSPTVRPFSWLVLSSIFSKEENLLERDSFFPLQELSLW